MYICTALRKAKHITRWAPSPFQSHIFNVDDCEDIEHRCIIEEPEEASGDEGSAEESGDGSESDVQF